MQCCSDSWSSVYGLCFFLEAYYLFSFPLVSQWFMIIDFAAGLFSTNLRRPFWSANSCFGVWENFCNCFFISSLCFLSSSYNSFYAYRISWICPPVYFSLFISICLSSYFTLSESSSTLSPNLSTEVFIFVAIVYENSFLFTENRFSKKNSFLFTGLLSSNLSLFHSWNFFSFLSEEIRILFFVLLWFLSLLVSVCTWVAFFCSFWSASFIFNVFLKFLEICACCSTTCLNGKLKVWLEA